MAEKVKQKNDEIHEITAEFQFKNRALEQEIIKSQLQEEEMVKERVLLVEDLANTKKLVGLTKEELS